jgi:Zn-dependent peptidase ImmA (M78 family)
MEPPYIAIVKDLNNGKDGREATVNLANWVLDRYKQEDQIIKAPYNAYRLAKMLGITVEENSNIKSSGKFLQENGRYKILISTSDNNLRRNYTCAHEIGHLWFASNDKIDRFNKTDKKFSEENFRCNLFAATLLMPNKEFCSIFNDLTQTRLTAIKVVNILARRFRVNLLAAVYRIIELRLTAPQWIFLMVKFMENPNPSKCKPNSYEPKLRVLCASFPPERIFIPLNVGIDKLGLSISISNPKERLHFKRNEIINLYLRQRNSERRNISGKVECEAFYQNASSPALGDVILGFFTIKCIYKIES